jgi:hypothetical protein
MAVRVSTGAQLRNGAYQRALVQQLLLKYDRIEPLGKWFAERLREIVRKEAKRLAADVVVPERCTGGTHASADSTKWTFSAGRARQNIYCVLTSGGKRYVALLQYERAVELTIYEFCC